MDFKTSVIWSNKIYKFLKKFNLEGNFDLDNIIDKNYPEILVKLQTYSRHEKIALCATNGKRTTTDIFNSILRAKNRSIITNVEKSAKLYPVLTSIVLDLAKSFDNVADIAQKDNYTMAFDEFEILKYFNSMRFDYLLLHNLFVDQKSLIGLEEKRKNIQSAISLNSKLNLVINADEPMFFNIDEIKNDTAVNKKRRKIFYGFDSIECYENSDLSQKNDIQRCPKCKCLLDWKSRFYSHIGQYDCDCGFKRPELDIRACAKVFWDYSFLTVYYKEDKFVFKLPFGGVYNVYNALGAIALAISLNIDRKTITKALECYNTIKARDDVYRYKGKKIKIKIIKNPTSLSEAVRGLCGVKNVKVVICFSDDTVDGVDTSWIWDSNLSALANFENKVYVCSNRYDDMALRLKYANVNPSFIIMDLLVKRAIESCFWELEENESMLILTVPSLAEDVYEVLEKNCK